MNKSYRSLLLFFALLGAFVFYSGVAGTGNLNRAKIKIRGNTHKAINLVFPVMDNSPPQQIEKKQVNHSEVQNNGEEEEEEGC